MLAPGSSALLLVTMPVTPGQRQLDGVKEEAETIQNTLRGLIIVKLHELPTVKDVMEDLPFYDSVHFACHGGTDPQSPFQSHLLLCGDEPDKGFNENTRNYVGLLGQVFLGIAWGALGWGWLDLDT